MEDQEHSTRSRVHYLSCQSSFSPDAPACSVSSLNNGESIQRPVTTPNGPQPGKEWQFVPEHPNNTTPNTKKPRNLEKLQAIKAAGGSCVWCRLRKTGCSETTPCEECTRTHRPCLRDSSLCLAKPTRNDTQFQLSDKIFRHAQETLEYFRDEHNKEPLVGNETVSVDWGAFNGITLTWSEELYQLHSDKIDDSVRTSLVDITLKSISIPQLEQPGHFEPLYDDSLYKDAYVMFRLFAAIEKISKSVLTIQPMHALTSRFVMFLMLTICTMEIIKVSISFVSCLEGAIQDNRLGEYQVQLAVEIYRQLIKRLASFQKPDSFLSDLFCQIQPRLNGIQTGVDKILSTLPQEQHIVFPSISEVRPFPIAIRITSEKTGILPLDPLLDMIPNGFPCWVNELLRRDFNQYMIYVDTSLEPPTGGGAIDPQLLTIQGLAPRSEVPSTRTSTIGADNIFSAPGDSQETDITATIFCSADLEDDTSNTIVDSYLDLLGFGGHLLY